MKAWDWVKNNIAAILVPLASGAIALVISYGTQVEEETKLLARIDKLEELVTELEEQDEEFDDDFDNLEDLVNDKSRAIEQIVITEGRDLERKIIRLEGRVDNLGRRVAYIDGIGAPTYGPTYSIESLDELLLEEDMPVESTE